MGLLTQNDVVIYRGWFKEMAKLRGLPVKYKYVVDFNDSIHGEVTPNKLSDSINLDVIYDENPKVKTLRSIGWVSESPDDKPYIMMFPFDTPNLTVEARVEVPMIDALHNRARIFKVTSINTLIEFPDCYVTTIVPVVDSDKSKPDYTDSNFNYVDNNHSVRQ